MGWDVIAYWICFISGVVYALIAALLGGLFGFEHGGDMGGIEGGDGGLEPAAHDFGTAQDVSAGHGEAFGGAGPGEVAISPLSPMTMATFSTVFGGTGLILTSMFKLSLFVTLPVSVIVGILVAVAVFSAFYRIFASVQASSEVRMGSIVGLTAEVSVAIPKDGVGEVVYVALGNRYTAIARPETARAIPRHATVRITRVAGSTVYVAPVEGAVAGSEQPPQ
ncbi:MAG: NfeD family protein [Armatimonadota bacterium]|nr:MAG: NfeD family protein [Armatimonadota bacterium]